MSTSSILCAYCTYRQRIYYGRDGRIHCFRVALRTSQFMTDRKIFDLFYGARENDLAMCERAYETGADINFAFDGRRATKGGAGRWYG